MKNVSYKSTINNIDFFIALAGLGLGLFVVTLYFISATIQLLLFGSAMFFGCLVYLFVRDNKGHKSYEYITLKEKILYEILFTILFLLSLYVLFTSYGRPPIYFLIISACAGLTVISIFNSTIKREVIVQIIKIFLISFNIKYSIYYFYGGIPGIDSWTHAVMNNALSQEGSINVLIGKEIFFPIMHLEVAITEIMTNTGIKDASNIAVTVPFVISTIFVFLIGKELFNAKIGLLSMLISNITDFHTYWGSAPQTTTFGIILYYIILFVLFKSVFSNNKINWVIISLLLIGTMILSHAVSSFIFMITLISLSVGSIIYKMIFNRSDTRIFGNLWIIAVIALLQHWFVAIYSASGRPFFDVIVSSLEYYITGYADFLERPESSVEYVAQYLPPFIERLVNVAGFTMLIFFSVIGCLFWLSSNNRNKINFSLIICITTLLGITFIFPLFGLRNIIPTRWFAFEYFFLSIMVAFSIIKISEIFKNSYSKNLFMVAVLFSLTFLMSANTLSNLDSPLWLRESTISTSYTFKEIYGAETLSRYSNNITSDNRYGTTVLGVYLGINKSTFKLEDNLFNSENKIFIWRNYMLNRPVRYLTTIKGYNEPIEENKILGPQFLELLGKYEKIYSNSDISGYYIR